MGVLLSESVPTTPSTPNTSRTNCSLSTSAGAPEATTSPSDITTRCEA